MPETATPPTPAGASKAPLTRAERRKAARQGAPAKEAPKAPALPPGAPTPAQITAFTKSLEARLKDALGHVEFIVKMNEDGFKRKTHYVYEATAEDLLGELLERLESPQEYMVITIRRSKDRKGRVSTEFGFDINNWPSAAISARLEKAAGIAKNRYLQGGDI